MIRGNRGLAWAGAAAALSLGAALLMQTGGGPRRSDDAPGRTARRPDFDGWQVAGRAVTIAAPPQLINGHWLDPEKLNRFLGEGIRVERREDRFLWTVTTLTGETAIETDLVADRPGEMLVWRSADGAGIELEAKVRLCPAPAGRGTAVEAHIAWRPPLGRPGHWAARLSGTDPGTRGRQALKRLKMLLETGEIATADNRRAA